MAIFKAIDKSSKNIGGSKGVLDYVGKRLKIQSELNVQMIIKKPLKTSKILRNFIIN